jgi:hypothetical protein
MNTMTTHSRSAPSDDQSRPQLEMLLIYEDAATALRGKLALDRVLRRPEVMADAHLRVWKLDMLRDPSCRAAATQDALEADILALSAHGHNRLDPEAETSLQQWVSLERSRPCALVISLDPGTRPSDETHPSLNNVTSAAARYGLTVLYQHGEVPHTEMTAVVANIQHRADAMAPVLEEILNRPDPNWGWGINE